MEMKTEDTLRNRLGEILLPQGFTRRGHAFFRVQGKDVLQVVKFERERGLGDFCYYLNVGLFSMYEEIRPQWLTSTGCIPSHFVGLLYGERDAFRLKYGLIDSKQYASFNFISYDEQLLMLTEKWIPFLNDIDNQEKLIRAMITLDIQNNADPDTQPDLRKYAPYLYIGNREAAMNTIDNYFRQRRISESNWDDLDLLLKAGQPNDESYLRDFYFQRAC